MKAAKKMASWAKRALRRATRDTRGQGATEMMMVISVIVIAVVAAAYSFSPQFKLGVNDLATDVSMILSDHHIKTADGNTIGVDLAAGEGGGDTTQKSNSNLFGK